MRLFADKTTCKRCGHEPIARLAPTLSGSSGEVSVSLSYFPYAGCRCGRMREQHLDMGDVSDVVVLHHVPMLRRERWPLRRRRCGECDGRLEAEASLHEFDVEPRVAEGRKFLLGAALPAFCCSSCGTRQVDGADGALREGLADAMTAALRTYGLPRQRQNRWWLRLLRAADRHAELRRRTELAVALLARDGER